MRRFDTYLSGSFQPSIFFDFGEGKLFSNKFAESLRPFPLMSGKELKNGVVSGQYIYALKNGRYEKTDRICPRCIVGLGGNESNNIKVDVTKVVLLKDEGPLFLKDSVEPEVEVGYRPSVICMPQYAPITHNGVVYGEADPIKPIDGELFTVVVEPNYDITYDLQNNPNEEFIRKGSVLLCADKRRFKAEAYNSYSFVQEEEYKFKIGDEYCDFISLGVGSIIKIRSVVDDVDGKEIVCWIVENHKAFTPLPAYLLFDVECYYDEERDEIVDDHTSVEYEGIIYANRYIAEANASNGSFVDMNFVLSDDKTKDWRDRVIDMHGYEDNE